MWARTENLVLEIWSFSLESYHCSLDLALNMFDGDMFWFALDAPYEIHFFINLSLYSDFYLNNCNAFRYYYIVKIIFFKPHILNRYIKRFQISLNTPLFKTTLQKLD